MIYKNAINEHHVGNSHVYQSDCMDLLKQTPDKYYDLCICDPPYGLGFSDYERGKCSEKTRKRYTKEGKKSWDNEIPCDEYFNELKRVSKHQIIWGGNYFNLGICKGFIFWNKKQPVQNFASGEFAWTNFDRPARCFDYAYYGNINSETIRLHPTQKPVALYTWLLENYAKQGDKILDTHLGSQSSRIAAYKKGFDFWGFEIDKDYFEQGNERFEKSIEMPLFDAPVEQKQSSLF